VRGLWTLCTAEASLQDLTSHACDLFDADQRALLEWLDDTALLNKRGWAHEVNFAMAAPLISDLRASLSDRRGRRSRLLFAHAETLVPLLCRMGLFGAPPLSSMPRCSSSADVLPLPQPPAAREWVGASTAPMGANVAFIVYRRAARGRGLMQPAAAEVADPGRNGSYCAAQWAKEAGEELEHDLLRVTLNEQLLKWEACGGHTDVPLACVLDLLTPGSACFEDICDSTC